ncbi:zinc finger Y-chromosomal protein [Elysia marginata]|uniref:Zinc finger Y-chromosomal protein n=1 Tax=Elysia marginata TaxID=1093978 RepID=A0AAV4HLB9_9GAST|nr:zinc finger Y-chromosomal protein [Elysia marginata]
MLYILLAATSFYLLVPETGQSQQRQTFPDNWNRLQRTIGLHQEHNALAQLSCSECGLQFSSTRLYSRHKSEMHPYSLAYVCSVCGKGMQSKSSLRLHMASHGSRNHVCHICDYRFKLKHHLRDHLMSKHGLFQCRGCNHTFPKGTEADQHVLICEKLKTKG